MKITIPGNPIPKQRARHVRNGAYVNTYDPQDKLKKQVSQCIATHVLKLSTQDPMGLIKMSKAGNFIVEATFYMPTPKNDPQFKKNAKLWGFEQHNRKPDIDNLMKFYLDCANGILWHDDSQIFEIRSRKLYSDNPRTEIIVMTEQEYKPEDRFRDILNCFTPSEFEKFLIHCKKLGKMLDKSMYELSILERKTWIEDISKMIGDFSLDYTESMKKVKKRLAHDRRS